MKGNALYWSLADLLNLFVWGGELANPGGLPDKYPVVFVANHVAALGPIAVMSSLPVRLFPWVIADMLDFEAAPGYLRKDFVEPQLRLPPPISSGFAVLLSKVSVRLLRTVGCIPVWQGKHLLETYHISLEALADGKSLLIFPEDPNQKMNELYGMTPFYRGFTRLGEMYYKHTKKILRYYPLAVHPVAREIKVGKPISYNPYNDPIQERIRLQDVLESSIHNMYLDVVFEGYSGVPLPH